MLLGPDDNSGVRPPPARPARKEKPEKAAPSKTGLTRWEAPANLPAPPRASGRERPAPVSTNPFGADTVVLPGGGAIGPGGQFRPQENTKPPEPPASDKPPPPMTPEMAAALNERRWQLPPNVNKNKAMDLDFEKGGVKKLADYSYRISPEENQRLLDQYTTPGALYSGYAPPSDVNLNQNMPLMNMKEEESAALTWEQYDALSRDQRAAVDFNTLLVDARESDLNQSAYLSPEALTKYNETVEKIFGKGGGSEKVAPKTVDLLSKLDMNLVGQDLDEYLSLERGIDTTELADFKFSDKDIKTLDTEINGANPTYSEVRAPENMLNIDAAAVQKAQQVIKTALANPEALTYDFSSLMYGPSADVQLKGQPPMGFGDATQWANPNDAEMSGYFQKGLQLLSAPDPTKANIDIGNNQVFNLPAGEDPMSWLLSDMTGLAGYNKNTRQQFLDYVQNQVDLKAQYGSDEDATIAAMITKRAGLGG